MSKTKGSMRGSMPINKARLERMTQYKEYTEHTQVIALGDHVECKIRLQKTIHPDSEPEIGVDIRKFLHGKYPFKGGKQGIIIEKTKWIPFIQKAIDFTVSVFGAEVFDANETHSTPTPPLPEPPVKKPVQISQDEILRRSVAGKSVEEVNWGELSKLGKRKIQN